MAVFKFKRGCAMAILALLSGAPAAMAQTSAPAASSMPKTLGGDVTVTIFAPRHTANPALRQLQLNRYSASSCAFMSGGVADTQDEIADAYMQDFYGPDYDPNKLNAPGNLQTPTFTMNAPFGDAAHESNAGTSLLPGMGGRHGGRSGAGLDSRTGCTPADNAFAAGRAYIAAHDTSLRDAYAAFDAKDYAKATTLFKTAWDKVGYPDAAMMIGEMELYGLGGPADVKDAITWLKKTVDFWRGAATPFDPNHPYAMTTGQEAAMLLAKIYLIGYQVPRDANEARHWYAKADELGYFPATHIMGLVYERGYGVKPDLAKAVSYFKRSANAEYAPSQYELGSLYYTGGDGVPQDKARAGAWIALAAKRGYPDALYTAGRMYDLGEGGAKADPQRALVYYKEAAVKGQPDAQNAIALSFYQGQGLPKDDKTARIWFAQAAERGSPDAMFNYAVMLARGEGGTADPTGAYAWMRLAQMAGLDKAGPAADELAGKLSPEEKARADAALGPKAPAQ